MTMPDALTFEQYAAMAKRTGQGITLLVAALGIAGEAGEVADLVKKIEGHGWDLDDTRWHLAEEIGDLLWYCAMLCELIGLPISGVARRNILKLAERYPVMGSSLMPDVLGGVWEMPNGAKP